MKVIPKSKWVYVGEATDYHGLVCTVGHLSSNQINAWSDIYQGDDKDPGLTWRGPRDRFLIEFKPHL